MDAAFIAVGCGQNQCGGQIMDKGNLSLTIALNETICIGDDIKVTLVEQEFRRQRVRLAIEAPRDVEVDREIIRQRKQIEKRQRRSARHVGRGVR